MGASPPTPQHTSRQPAPRLDPPAGGFFDGKTTAEERQRYLLDTIRASAAGAGAGAGAAGGSGAAAGDGGQVGLLVSHLQPCH